MLATIVCNFGGVSATVRQLVRRRRKQTTAGCRAFCNYRRWDVCVLQRHKQDRYYVMWCDRSLSLCTRLLTEINCLFNFSFIQFSCRFLLYLYTPSSGSVCLHMCAWVSRFDVIRGACVAVIIIAVFVVTFHLSSTTSATVSLRARARTSL